MTTSVALAAQVTVETVRDNGVAPVTVYSNAVRRHRWDSHGYNNRKMRPTS